jgi:hypothetical protein
MCAILQVSARRLPLETLHESDLAPNGRVERRVVERHPGSAALEELHAEDGEDEEEEKGDHQHGSRKALRLPGDGRRRVSPSVRKSYQQPKKKMGASDHRRLAALPKAAKSHPRARRIISYYVGNISAEMATVLRNDAIMLTRLREKMGVTN